MFIYENTLQALIRRGKKEEEVRMREDMIECMSSQRGSQAKKLKDDTNAIYSKHEQFSVNDFEIYNSPKT